jgi:hypothetical protein
MGEVISLYVVVALLVSRGLRFFLMRVVEQNQSNPYKCGSSHSKVVPCAPYIQLAEGCHIASYSIHPESC